MMMGPGDGLGILMPARLNHSGEEEEALETVATSGLGSPQGRAKEERLPLWGQQETRDFIAIRGELEGDFNSSKRNKTLWEAVASRMKEKGHWRSPDQCKCKWKNLVNRYKGKETSDADNGKHCPFFDELHAIFTERAFNMQRLIESETGTHSNPNKKLKRSNGDKSLHELSDGEAEEDDNGEDSNDEHRLLGSGKRKAEKVLQQRRSEKLKAANIFGVLQDFIQQQQRAEAQWRDSVERMAQERRMLEQEWRQSMEKLESERLLLDQAWQQREEQRRVREENRAIKRDALLTTLLTKLIQEDA